MNGRWILVALLFVSAAAAHAEPYESDPSAGERLESSPDTVRVAFTEPMFEDGSWIRVLDNQGERVDLGDLTFEGKERPILTVSVPALSDGPYRIAWQTYSETDGHTVQGSIGFAVGGFAPPETEVQKEAIFDGAPSVGRALLYAGFSAGIGALAFAAWMKLGVNSRFLQAGATLAVLGTTIILWDTWQGTGLPLITYLASDGGSRLLARLIVLCGLLVLTWVWTKIRPGMKIARFALASLWGLAAFQSAQWGHITQQGTWGAWLELVHLLAAAIWIGGLASFLAYLPPAKDVLTEGQRFGRLAMTSAITLASTGLLLSGLLLYKVFQISQASIWTDSWTWFLALKIAAFVLMLVAAVINRYGYLAEQPPNWLRGILPKNGNLKSVVKFELSTSIVAIIAAGMLLSVSPPQVIEQSDPPLELAAQGEVFTALLQIAPYPSTETTHTMRFFIQDDELNSVSDNSCGRENCIMASWVMNGDEGTKQEAEALPEGDGWWRVESVLFTQSGDSAVTLHVQTGYVYLDKIEFEQFSIN